MSRCFVAQKWVAALALALGVGTVWGVVAVLIGSIVGTLMPGSPRTNENVVVAVDGTPLIQSQIAGNYYNSEFRTLEGQTIELEEENWLGGARFGKPYREPGLVNLPISWRQRVAGCGDYSKPPANWLLMRDDRRPGSAYFTGYDTVSKLGLGFIGRGGFRSTVPPADEQFDLGNRTLGWGRAVSTGQINFGGSAYRYGSRGSPVENRRLAHWLVFLVDGISIQEIDLRNRKVRTLGKLDQLLALTIASLPLPVADDANEATEKQEDPDKQTNRSPSKFRLAAMQNWAVTIYAPDVQIDSKRKTAHRLLARCTDRIVAINPFDGSQQEFSLPERIKQKGLTAYMVTDDQLLLQVGQGPWEQGSVVDLLWINTSGEVDRQETLRLAGYVPPDPRGALLAMTAVAPSLLPWAVGSAIVAPLTAVQKHAADSYMAGLRQTLSQYWPMLVLFVVLSIALTWVTYRWQKKYCRDNTPLWCATVFATTVPGLLAYWILHRGTVMESCGECGQSAPRDRDACAHCDKPFAAPQLLGTEIFA